MDLSQIARLLAGFGLALLVAAGAIYLVSRLNPAPGQLPGDLVISRGNFSCIVPLLASLVISVVLTIIINLLLSYLRK